MNGYYYSYFTDEETVAHRNKVTLPASPSHKPMLLITPYNEQRLNVLSDLFLIQQWERRLV